MSDISEFMVISMEKIIKVIVEGGKASGGPPLGPALGPLGINTGEVVKEINDKTKDFAGVKVPVKVIVDPGKKTFSIEVGSPSTAELIKKTAGIKKGAGNREAPAGNISFADALKIAKQKQSILMSTDIKSSLKEVLGTAVSLGVTVDEKNPKDVIKEVNEGKYDGSIGS